MCHSPVLKSRSFSHFFPPSVIFSTDVPIVRADRVAITKIGSSLAHKDLFPRKKNALVEAFSPSKWKGPKPLTEVSAEIWTMCSAQVIIKGEWLEFVQNKREPIKGVIWERLCTGSRESCYKVWQSFSLSAVSKLQFHNSFSAAARLPAQCECWGHCQGWGCPWPVPLDGSQSPAANISQRKKGHFSPSFSLWQTWTEFHGTWKNLTPLPSGSFSPAKFQRSVSNHLWLGFLQVKSLQEFP